MGGAGGRPCRRRDRLAGVLRLLTSPRLPGPSPAALAIAADDAAHRRLHEDGLSDMADGFGGGRTRERKLEIMRDSRIGAYGAAGAGPVGAAALERAGRARDALSVSSARWSRRMPPRALLPVFMRLVAAGAQRRPVRQCGRDPGSPLRSWRGLIGGAALLCPGHSRRARCRGSPCGSAFFALPPLLRAPDRRPDRRHARRAAAIVRDHCSACRLRDPSLNSDLEHLMTLSFRSCDELRAACLTLPDGR